MANNIINTSAKICSVKIIIVYQFSNHSYIESSRFGLIFNFLVSLFACILFHITGCLGDPPTGGIGLEPHGHPAECGENRKNHQGHPPVRHVVHQTHVGTDEGADTGGAGAQGEDHAPMGGRRNFRGQKINHGEGCTNARAAN